MSQGLKPKIIKAIVLLISICYVFGPFLNHIDTSLHSFFHFFEVPNYVLEHSEDATYHNHQIGEAHQYIAESHDHKILESIDTFFESINTDNHQEKTPVKKIKKIDKHLTKEITLKNIFPQFEWKNTISRNIKDIILKDGYKTKFKEPPRYS